jgi:hypothetical protein
MPQPPTGDRVRSRLGPPKAWQSLGRSFEALLASLDDEEATFADHARAYRAVGAASRALADALTGAPPETLAAGCSVCAKPRQELRRLIAGPASTSATNASTCASKSSRTNSGRVAG